ncbi:yemanuclein-like [Phymastichus coffea]|uniref:yemanuclein-like n=1 Tax=Phymastichus coffea TaxID=108790 RepID=UPI00273B2F99|nr:yemanuclein-like [Phymastichus coffea]
MAEIKRVTLQPVDDGQSSKKSSKTAKQVASSFRFEINLIDSNEETYTEVNYAQLLKSAEKKQRKEKKSDYPTNGFTKFPDDDDDDKILDVARYYEEKYGNRKRSDYVDLGAGYDENDSFIDNTDAYDEVVPEEMTTVHGGFYVNSGPLEFKDSDKVNRKNNTNGSNKEEENKDDKEKDYSDEENYSSSDKETEGQVSNVNINKRRLSFSKDEETEISQQPPKSKICTAGIEQLQPPTIMIRTDLTKHQQPAKSKLGTDDAECVIID